MDINKRLFNTLDSKNLKKSDLAKYLNINNSVVSTWKSRGTNPPSELLTRICDFLDVSLEFLVTGTDVSLSNKQPISHDEFEILNAIKTLNTKQRAIIIGKIYEYEEFNKIEEIKNNTSKISVVQPKTVSLKEEINIPEYIELKLYTQRASAGIGKYNYEEDNYEVTKFDISKYPQAKKADHVIIVEGDSMSSTIENGQYIFVREQVQIEPNEIGVFVYKDTVYCKRLHIDRKKRKLSLVSDNKNYQNIEIENIKELRTIGKVIL